MTTNLTADTGTEQMAQALHAASDELEGIAVDNDQIADEFEGHGWSGMDALGTARADIAAVRESLADVAEMIGVGGAVVRGARLDNQMATNADAASLGRL